MQEGSPQRGGSILCCCEERSRRRTFTAKTVLTLLTERRHNRLHSNWGKKTLCRSTPRRPCSNCDLVNMYLVPTVQNFHVENILCCKYFVAEKFCALNFRMAAAHTKIFL